MGLGRVVLQEIAALKRVRTFGRRPSVVEIGAQQLSNDFLRADHELREIFKQFGRDARPFLGMPIVEGQAGGLEIQSQEAPASQTFWEALGFEYATIDFDGHRHARALDLNKDDVPDEWRERFDLVVNAGTTEHVANQDNAFRVIHDLARKGGVMMHELPAMGMLTHGLVIYTMKFFWHLCRENKYQVLRLEMYPGGTATLPGNIVSTSQIFGRPGHAATLQSEPIRDWSIIATLRKPHNKAFVTPLDVPPEVMPTHHRGSTLKRQQEKTGHWLPEGRHVLTTHGIRRWFSNRPLHTAPMPPPLASADFVTSGSRDEAVERQQAPSVPIDRGAILVETEPSFLIHRDLQMVITQLGVHPFILVRRDDKAEWPDSFLICQTQNDAARFADELALLPGFGHSSLIRGVERALHQEIQHAADLFYTWIVSQTYGLYEMVHLGDPAVVNSPAFFGYPAFSFMQRAQHEDGPRRLAALNDAFGAYLATTGNDALRLVLIQALATAIARALTSAGQPEQAISVLDRAVTAGGSSREIEAARSAVTLTMMR